MNISLFIPGYVDQLHPEIGFAVADVLGKLGHEIDVPEGQTCRSQPAMTQVKTTSAEATEAKVIVSTDPSCLLQIQGYLDKQKILLTCLHLSQILNHQP